MKFLGNAAVYSAVNNKCSCSITLAFSSIVQYHYLSSHQEANHSIDYLYRFQIRFKRTFIIQGSDTKIQVPFSVITLFDMFSK